MADVLDVVTRLSYEVTGSESIKVTVDNLNAQATAINKNIELLERMKKSNEETIKNGATDEYIKKAALAQQQLQKSIDQKTASLTKSFVEDKKLQTYLQNEIGLIGQLTNKLNELKVARASSSSVAGITTINKEIEGIRGQLKELETMGTSGGGVLSSLFGSSGSFGKQLLTGGLIGIGFGSGIGLITRAVSGLTEYAEVELSATKRSEALLKANDDLAKSFKELSTSVVEYNENLRLSEIFYRKSYDATTDGAAREEERVKALGVVKGEAFKADEAQFAASQVRRQSELADIERIQSAMKAFKDKIEDVRMVGGETSAPNIINTVLPDLERIDKVNEIIKELEKAKLPTKEFEKIKNSLEEAKKTTASIATVLKEVDTELAVVGVQQEQKRLDKAKEISNAETKRQSDIAEKRYSKERELQLQVSASNETLRQLKEKEDIESVDKIIHDTEAKYKVLNKAILKEQEETIKANGKLSKAEIDGFNDRLLANDEQQIQDAANLIFEFEQKQLSNSKKIGLGLLQGESSIESTNAALGLPNYERLSKAYDAQTKIKIEAQKQQFETFAATITDSDQLIEAQKQQDERLIQIDREAYRDRLNLATTYYAQLAKEINEQSNLLAERAETDILNRGGSSTKVNRRIAKNADIAGIAKDQKLGLNAQRAVNDSNAAIDSAQNEDQLNAATKKNEEDQKKLADIENDQAKKERDLREIRKQEFAEKIDLLQAFTQATVDSFNTIADARAKDLDREISVREQRVTLATTLAERGNTQALAQEQKALEKSEEQRRKAALQQQEINAALTVSNSIVAVAKAAAEGGAFAPATIAAVIAALAVGISQAVALNQSSKAQFDKGGYTGDGGKYDTAGTVHRGEFVFTKERTAQYRPLFEAIHRGHEILPIMSGNGNAYDISILSRKLDAVVDAVNGKSIKVSQNLDKGGLHQLVTEYGAKQRQRFK